MKIIKIIAWLSAIAMVVVLSYGFTAGNFFIDGGELLANPWGIVSVVDLYVGFIIFSVWIWLREQSSLVKILWIIAMMIFGFFTASVYLLKVSYQSRGNWRVFAFGQNHYKYLN